MKKAHLTHLAWASVAFGAFAVGHKTTSTNVNADSNEATTSSNRSSTSTSRSNRGNSTSNFSSSRSSTSKNRTTSNTTPLTENEIIQLGQNLKNAKGPLERRNAFNQILDSLTAENAVLLREQILHLDDNGSNFQDFHYLWGSIAGEDALIATENSPEKDVSSIFAGWIANSPDAAIAYYNSLDEQTRRNSALKWGAITALTETDPDLAVQFALDQQAAGDRQADRLIDNITRRVLRTGETSEAAEWAANLPAGEMQEAALNRVSREYADENPTEAYQWASTLPTGTSQNRAMTRSFYEWAREDPQTAAQTLSSMTDSAAKDSATYGYANRVAREDPQTAIEWASTITNEETRTRALIETGRSFYRSNPDAAKEWLNNSNFTDAQKQTITRGNRNGRRRG